MNKVKQPKKVKASTTIETLASIPVSMESKVSDLENAEVTKLAPKNSKDLIKELETPINIYNPLDNHKAISIIEQPDGNFVGYAWKFGKVVKARQGDPTTVLQLLLTHDGKSGESISR